MNFSSFPEKPLWRGGVSVSVTVQQGGKCCEALLCQFDALSRNAAGLR
jgi:hypothetical protein